MEKEDKLQKNERGKTGNKVSNRGRILKNKVKKTIKISDKNE